MSSLSDFFLTAAVNYGAPALALGIFLSGLGIPLPGTLLMVVGGVFVRDGVLDLAYTAGLAFLGSVMGDCASFAMGRFASGWLLRRFGQTALWQKARLTFDNRGALTIFLSRFWLTSLGAPVNLIAGGMYPFGRFLAIDMAGELIWVALYGTLGYIFGVNYEEVISFMNDFGGFSIGLLSLGVGVHFLVRWRRKNR